MFGLFRRGAKPSAHPAARELHGLTSCLVAWRRATLEAQFQDHPKDLPGLEERRSSLAWYAKGVGGTDPFSAYVLQERVGELEESAFLEALYRIETAASIAWAIGCVARIPPLSEGADWAALDALLPADAGPSAGVRQAQLRPAAELDAMLATWTEALHGARQARDRAATEGAAIEYSRAYERVRGLAWVRSDAEWVEDTVMA